MHLKHYFGALLLLSNFAVAATPANASVVINALNSGSNLVFNAFGSLDLTNAEFTAYQSFSPGYVSGAGWYVAQGDFGVSSEYLLTSFDGAYGTGNTLVPPDSSSGGNFFIWAATGHPVVGLPTTYQSGDAISWTMSFFGSSILSAGLIAGSYVYAIPSDTITLNIGPVSAVPVPAAVPLLATGLGALGLIGRKRRRKSVIGAL